MPRLHKYVRKNGYYIKAAHRGLMITYQLSPEGNNYLIVQGFGDGDDLDWNTVNYLISCGWAYTAGSGPGIVDPWVFIERNDSANYGPIVVFAIIFFLILFLVVLLALMK
jgi:hypothetical protein